MDDIEQRVRSSVSLVLPGTEGARSDALLSDLGMDSKLAVELVFCLEDAFSIEFELDENLA